MELPFIEFAKRKATFAIRMNFTTELVVVITGTDVWQYENDNPWVKHQ